MFESDRKSFLQTSKPLAERMRPQNLDQFAGQQHLIGEGAVIRQAISSDRLFSMILWGPPGCGKTTLARIIAEQTRSHFIHFSAVLAGVKDIRAVIEDAKEYLRLYQRKTVLFVDEIHRFNKAQQDAFLHHVESGLITLIGATTENPSFEVISPLLSRCRVMVLNALSPEDIGKIIETALNDSENGLGSMKLSIEDTAMSHLIRLADGDARVALNNLEIAANFAQSKHLDLIRLEDVEEALQKHAYRYDRAGEEHYNLISAFHKSLRGSDPDAALYWLIRMLSSGEDPLYVARRMIRFASEDIGNADPYALGVALNAMQSYHFLGSPEGELSLAQAAVYLATAPKSNSIYVSYGKLKECIQKTGSLPVPLHIRNAPTKLMKDLGYGKDYKYAHDYKDAYVAQSYLPDELKNETFYFPTERGYEKTIKQRLDKWRKFKAERAEKA